jgi:hypothetical protein
MPVTLQKLRQQLHAQVQSYVDQQKRIHGEKWTEAFVGSNPLQPALSEPTVFRILVDYTVWMLENTDV